MGAFNFGVVVVLPAAYESVGTDYYFVVPFVREPKDSRFFSAAKFTKRLGVASMKPFRPIVVPDRAIRGRLVQKGRQLIEFLRAHSFKLLQKRSKVAFLVAAVHIHNP